MRRVCAGTGGVLENVETDQQHHPPTPGSPGAGARFAGAWLNARAVVVGDVDLLRDELLDEGAGNGTFVTGALRWLARSDEPLARVGRTTSVRRLELGESQLRVVRWTLVLGVPLLVALAGLGVWWTRRDA